MLLRREGLTVNHKRVHRLYKAAGLQVRKRRRKRVVLARMQRPAFPVRPNQRWSMDFMRDTLKDGRVFRTLTSWTIVLANAWRLRSTRRSPVAGWSPCSNGSPKSETFRRRSSSITALNLQVRL